MTRNLVLALFLVLVATSGLFMALTLPPGEGNDETAHVLRAAAVLDGTIIGTRRVAPHAIDGKPFVESGFDLSVTYLQAMQYRPRTADGRVPPATAEARRVQETLGWSRERAFFEASNTAIYSPTVYLPAALGIGLLHALGATPEVAIKAGRIGNLLFYLLVGGAALVLAQRGRLLLLVLLSLPMSIVSASCIGQDGPIIALTAFACAGLGRMVAQADWSLACGLAVAALTLVIIAKPPYIVLAAAPWIAAVRWPRVRWADALVIAAPILLPVLWTAIAGHYASVPYTKPAYAPGPLWPILNNAGSEVIFRGTDPGAQLKVLLAAPWLFFTLPITSIAAEFASICREFVGVLSWRDLPLPGMLYPAWYATIVAGLVLGFVGPRTRLRPILVTLMLIGTVYAICLAQYLTWTSVGDALIDGLQGRYFIPVVMLLPLAMPVQTENPPRWATVWVLALLLLDGTILERLIVTRFYLP